MPRINIAVRAGALLRDIAEAVGLAIVLFLILRVGVQSTVVEGASMHPNFVDGEWVLVNKLAYRWGAPERGDVIVFAAPNEPEKDYIKRIAGLPGETVHLRSGQLYINGTQIDQPWGPVLDQRAFGPFTVPDDQVFVMGDNRPQSNDSRLWPDPGLAMESVVGKVWVSVWPLDTWGLVESDGPGPAQFSADTPGS